MKGKKNMIMRVKMLRAVISMKTTKKRRTLRKVKTMMTLKKMTMR